MEDRSHRTPDGTLDTESEFRRKTGPFFRVLGIVAAGTGLGVGVWSTPELQGLIKEGFLEVGLRNTGVMWG